MRDRRQRLTVDDSHAHWDVRGDFLKCGECSALVFPGDSLEHILWHQEQKLELTEIRRMANKGTGLVRA
jgi:hypothetical protein